MRGANATRSIGDYGLIGNCRSAALVSREGSIDWLCWPRFDSPALFSRALDPGGGFFRISPAPPFVARRTYLPRTNVLQTRFETTRGEALLVDCMPLHEAAGVRHSQEELLRCVRCTAGEITLEAEFVPRARFGTRRPRLKPSWMGVRAELGGRLLLLRGTHAIQCQGPDAWTRFTLKQGEQATWSLSWSEEAPAVLPATGDEAWRLVDRTAAFWRRWVQACQYRGPWREDVLRSALVLKALTFAPTGAMVAAPTTSLPEREGGGLNWDYRFCWLRDASFVSRALLALGHGDEAEAFADWMVHATRLTHPRLEVLYDVYGRRPPRERELHDYRGWKRSRPVRVGNAARDQLQLDVYGEVVDAVARTALQGAPPDRESGGLLVGLGRAVCRHWHEPDESIWEVRTGRAHHTFSKALCWTALDRLLMMARRGMLPNAPVALFARTARAIRRDVTTHGIDRTRDTFTAAYGKPVLDASLLLLPMYGFVPHDDPTMLSTWRAIRQRLSPRPGLLYRYEDEQEGAFGICSFWAAHYLADGGGTLQEAWRWFEQTMAYRNDLGLFAEEVAPDTGEPLGNFPQAFTHVGLINAAISLERRARTESGRSQTSFTAYAEHDRHAQAPPA